MEGKELTFSGMPFLEKEAAPNLQGVLNGVKNTFQQLRRSTPPNPGEAAPTLGKFVVRPGDSVVNPAEMNLFDRQQVIDKTVGEMKREGTGSFVVDGLLGLTKKVFPGSKDGIENAVVKSKGVLEHLDAKGGQLLAGKNPDSFRGKLLSSKVSRQVGEVKDPDGKISPLLREDRKPSLAAMVEKPVKFVTPFLATAYAADKLYPNQPAEDKNVAVPTYETELQKQSSELESDALFDKTVVDELDKVASLQKIAKLEDELEKVAAELQDAHMEKLAMEKRLVETEKEKDFFEKQASETKNNLLEKTAAFEELRLRTIAQKRSKVAVDLSEKMLECGFIKQAELADTQDELMVCDERTIKMYQNLVKEAKTQEESLESLAILGEYKGNDKLASQSKDLAPHGLSKRGQSIGEAARDLIK